jgi:hypothetical protein
MSGERHVEKLMDKLVRAIEVSLRSTEASREVIQEILRRGAETGIFFSVAGRSDPATGDAACSDGEPFDLTQQDRDFLRSLAIRPDSR